MNNKKKSNKKKSSCAGNLVPNATSGEMGPLRSDWVMGALSS
jgi:hypothetical protein